MPEAVAEQAEKELRPARAQGEQSPESSMIRSYLDWLIAVPWSQRSEEKLDPVHTARCSTPTTRLDDVKRRITEFIASASCARSAARARRKPRQRRDPDPGRPARHRQTSIGESIARASGASSSASASAACNDEAEIRGTGRT